MKNNTIKMVIMVIMVVLVKIEVQIEMLTMIPTHVAVGVLAHLRT